MFTRFNNRPAISRSYFQPRRLYANCTTLELELYTELALAKIDELLSR